jgi:hypothetical protein
MPIREWTDNNNLELSMRLKNATIEEYYWKTAKQKRKPDVSQISEQLTPTN